MKKILFVYFTLLSFVFGYNYDEVLLKAQASIFPKIILLDKKIENKLIDDKIVYTIVYDKADYYTALSIEKYINENFNGKLDKYNYKINLVDFKEFSEKTEASAIYVLNLDEHIEKIAIVANTKGVISFSYDINNLKRGLMFSLVIEKSTVLYLEKDNLYTTKVEFVDALLQMVRFIDKDHEMEGNKEYLNKLGSKNLYAGLLNNIFDD